MAFIKIALALCASLYVTSAQFTPGPKPACSATTFMAHETYCDLYYRCLSPSSGLVASQCGIGTQWDAKHTVCNTVSIPNTGVCASWTCNGNRYPDICCNKYWTCSQNNAWVSSDCPAGTTFDMSSGQCLSSGSVACIEHAFCTRNRTQTLNYVCGLQANPSGDKCTYIQANYVRRCPTGSSFDQATCGCSNFDTAGCPFRFDFAANKARDTSCRASFRTKFDSSLSLTAFSDKLGMSISDLSSTPNLKYGGGFFLGATDAVSVNANEALLLSNGYIYSNYFANNEILTPTAFVVEFRPTNFLTGSSFELLSNTFSIISDVICTNSLTVTVRNDGSNNNGNLNDYRYTFTISMGGFNPLTNTEIQASINDLSIVLPQSTLTNFGDSGTPRNYLRFTLALSETNAQAEVLELNGNTGLSNANRVRRAANFNINHLNSSRCGLTVGSTMTGSVRQFTVYEGCANGFTTLLSQA